MKNGFVLISTLALIVILSFLVLILSKTIYSDTLKTTVYANSIEKRIEIINYESFLVDLLIDNSILNRNLTLAEQEINFAIQKKFPQLTVSLTDYSTCFNINSLVKPFQNINVKNEVNGQLFTNLLKLSDVDRSIHNELLDRLYDALDNDSLPETYGAEDLFYISNDALSLSPDQLFIHKSQIKNLALLNKNNLERIYSDICSIPTTELTFNVNSLNLSNAKVFLALFSELTLNDIERILLNKPINGYTTYKNFVDISGIDENKIDKSRIIFKPDFIMISYLLAIEGQIFNFVSLLSLQRNNFVVYRTLAK
ncbi:MAG: general secretion pathway protein GspK [Gammaproteobacteria bacterium]|tara:strand:- start:768 stop:1700 length:933 start_codon:yes stop_codon:yes gene_type:complete